MFVVFTIVSVLYIYCSSAVAVSILYQLVLYLMCNSVYLSNFVTKHLNLSVYSMFQFKVSHFQTMM